MLKPIVWLGDSLARLRDFPRERVRVGGAFRVLYMAKFDEAIYVLHAFRKKSQRTARLDQQLASNRFRNLVNDRRQP
jgi:phage-related protein